MTQPKNVDEMEIDELEREHLTLRRKINARREYLNSRKHFTKKHTDKLLALCDKLYGDGEIR